MDSPRKSTGRLMDEDGTIIGPCPSISSRASYWDVDSNFGCGDTVSVSETLDCINDSDVIYPAQTVANIERCMSCFSKLGAPTMSRSSTGNGTPCGFGQQQIWALHSAVNDSASIAGTCGHKNNHHHHNTAVDRMSLCSSQGSGSNNSEYSIAKVSNNGLDLWNAKDSIKLCTCTNGGTLTLRRNGLVCTTCDGVPPPKQPAKPKSISGNHKPPMPLPITTQLQPTQNQNIGAYENYDFPKVHPPLHFGDTEASMDNYDTPKKIHEYILASDPDTKTNTGDYSNYDMPTAIVGQMCGCLHTTTASSSTARDQQLNKPPLPGRPDCACNRVMSWADNWIPLPYCRRGNGAENTGIPVNKLKLTGEGKMPIMQMNQQPPPPELNQSQLYATVDVTKKLKSRLIDASTLKKCECSARPSGEAEVEDQAGSKRAGSPQSSNYINIEPSELENPQPPPSSTITNRGHSNYMNLMFAHSLDNYENAKEVIQRASRLINEDSDGSGQLVLESDVQICKKCGHASITISESSDNNEEKRRRIGGQETTLRPPLNPANYLVMEPRRRNPEVPGYLPMSPAPLSAAAAAAAEQPIPAPNTELVQRKPNIQIINDKSASNPSLHHVEVDVHKHHDDGDDDDGDTRIPEMSVERKQLINDRHILQINQPASSSKHMSVRARSASADSSRFLEDNEDFESSETLCKASLTNIHDRSQQRRLSSPCVILDAEPPTVNVEETEDEMSVSLNTQSNPTNSVNIRRSESVPCKAQNRDSSSSNDSGVSTGSLRMRSKDFEPFEMAGAAIGMLKKHRNSLPCTHVTLPRRSKSTDPLKELSFHFRKIQIPEKSTSAEAEIPICPPKGKSFGSPADAQSMTGTVPYIDSRSTSSGTSDMSDYIETLSMSSHSSSDAIR